MGSEEAAVEHLIDRVAYRYANYDTPLWARRNSRAGRWNIAREGSTQYWSLHPHGPWAELIRHEDLRTDADLALVRMRLWVARWSVGPVADLGTFERAETWGVDPEVLISDDHKGCRELGQYLRAQGFAGALCPSAALPESTNLVVFGARIMAPYDSVPRLTSRVPGAELAVGSPPMGLCSRVRYRGEAHPDFEAFRRTRVAVRRRPRPPTDIPQ